MQLIGKQIIIRDWVLTDIPTYTYWQTKDLEWKNWDGPYYPIASPERVEAGMEKRKKAILQNDFPNPRTFMVIADITSNELVGIVSWYWESQETNWLSNGIVIFNPQHRGKGIGFEALGLWNQYIFDVMPEVVRLDLRTWSGNTGMLRLAEKLGYQLEARFRKARIVKGEYFDGIGYGVLRSEWEILYPNGFATK